MKTLPFTLQKMGRAWFVFQRGSKFGRAATREEIWFWIELKRARKELREAREVR